MPVDFTIKQDDTAPTFLAFLLDPNDQPADLTHATAIRFIMRDKKTGVVKVNASGVVIGPPDEGLVEYAWQPGDTDTIGLYRAEWEVTYAGGAVVTYPNWKYYTIKVMADLDD